MWEIKSKSNILTKVRNKQHVQRPEKRSDIIIVEETVYY